MPPEKRKQVSQALAQLEAEQKFKKSKMSDKKERAEVAKSGKDYYLEKIDKVKKQLKEK